MRRWLAASLVAVALFGVACGGEESSPPRSDPTIPTLPPEEATTVPADRFAVPAVIDEAYVNRVLAGLEAALGDTLRLVVRQGAITQEVGDRLNSIYSSPVFLQLALDAYQGAVGSGFAGIAMPPGDRVTRVSSLITVRSDCIFVEVARDGSAISSTGATGRARQWVALVPSPVAQPGTNATHWKLMYDGFPFDGSIPSNPCS